MSTESDYLLKRVPSTNTTKEPTNATVLKIQEIWKLVIFYAGRDYIAEFLATFVLMVSSVLDIIIV